MSINWINHSEVLEIVRAHLFGKIDPAGGIFIGRRPKAIRLDVVTLNLLTALLNEDKEIIGVVNINIHHEDIDRIEVLNVAVIDIIDMAYLENHLFAFDRQYMFRLSRTLYMSNIRMKFTKNNIL